MDPNGRCLIAGESYPEDSYEFYAPIIKWMRTYIETSADKRCEFDFEMIYFNSSSSKILWDIFDMLEEYAQDGKNVAVNWIYEIDNDAGAEYGEEFSEDLEHLEFNFVVKEEK
jgi:hypothetical protein